MTGDETPGERRARERASTRRAGQGKVRGGFREGEALARRVARAEEAWSEDAGRLCLALESVEPDAGAAALAGVVESADELAHGLGAALLSCACDWCEELWAVSDLHDVAGIVSVAVILVCPVCDPGEE